MPGVLHWSHREEGCPLGVAREHGVDDTRIVADDLRKRSACSQVHACASHRALLLRACTAGLFCGRCFV